MDRKHNPKLSANAKTLRKAMTKEERHLWYDFLRSYPVRFLRQKVIVGYIDCIIKESPSQKSEIFDSPL